MEPRATHERGRSSVRAFALDVRGREQRCHSRLNLRQRLDGFLVSPRRAFRVWRGEWGQWRGPTAVDEVHLSRNGLHLSRGREYEGGERLAVNLRYWVGYIARFALLHALQWDVWSYPNDFQTQLQALWKSRLRQLQQAVEKIVPNWLKEIQSVRWVRCIDGKPFVGGDVWARSAVKEAEFWAAPYAT